MSTQLNKTDNTGTLHTLPHVDGLTVGIVCAEWNDQITGALLQGALDLFEQEGYEDITVARVPGTVELTYGAAQMARTGRYDAVIMIVASFVAARRTSTTCVTTPLRAVPTSTPHRTCPSSSASSRPTTSSRHWTALAVPCATRVPKPPKPPSRWPTSPAPSASLPQQHQIQLFQQLNNLKYLRASSPLPITRMPTNRP